MFESLSIKVACLQACNFIKKRLQHTYFPVIIAKLIRTAFFKKTSLAASMSLNTSITKLRNGNLTQDLQLKFGFKMEVIQFLQDLTDSSSSPELFCKKSVLRNFAKFIAKPLCQSLLFNKVEDLSVQLC